MAEIYNFLDNTLVSGTSKADDISNESSHEEGYLGENVTIRALAGNDTIYNVSNKVTIIGGKGNDMIELNEESAINNVILYASGDGNDTVIGFNSDDTLHINKGSYTTDTVGSDFIVTVGKGKILFKDALADKNNSINIQDSLGNIVTYNDWTVWSGNITRNTKNYVTLKGSKNNDTIGNVADDVLITGRAGNDKISNGGKYVTISGGSGKDTIINGGSNVTINGGTGADYISNGEDFEFSDVSINGGAGNDTIYIDGGGDITDTDIDIKDITITGGAGNDLITLAEFFDENEGHNISINGGSGNDTITNETYSSTITGGKGNDLISLNSYAKNNVIQYASGDGNDTIYGFDSDDILHITEGNYTAEVSGDDVIFRIGKGSITLKDAKGKEITITETKTFGSESSELFAENNFVAADNLSEIVAEKSVGKKFR